MKLMKSNANSFFKYYSIGNWYDKNAVDILFVLAKVIKSNPEDFYWNKYLDEIESKFNLSKNFIDLFNEIKNYLKKKDIKKMYLEHSDDLKKIRFILVVKLQILLILLCECEPKEVTNSDFKFYNTQDLDCIDFIYSNLVLTEFNNIKDDLLDAVNEIINIKFDISIEEANILKKTDSKFIKIICEYLDELLKLKNKKRNTSLYISCYSLRYKYLLIIIEKIFFSYNVLKFKELNIDNRV